MKSVVSVMLPVVWFAMLLAVVCSKPRHPLMDRITVVILMAVVCNVHFERRWLAVPVIGFASILLCTGFDTVESGPFAHISRRIATFRIPQPREFQDFDFVDVLAQRDWMETVSDEAAFYRFVSMISIMVLLCFSGDRAVRRFRGRAKAAPKRKGT